MYADREFAIPGPTKNNWQHMIDLLVESIEVKAGFVTRISGNKGRVLKASWQEKKPQNEEFLAEGKTFRLSEVFCHKTVKKSEMMEIKDSRQLEEKRGKVEHKMGFISYLGLPIYFPANQDIFGTLFVVDSEPRSFSKKEKHLFRNSKNYLENQLKNIILNNNLEREIKFTQSSLDALSAHLAIIDQQGIIKHTNEAWDNFAIKSGTSPEQVGVGVNYLKVTEKSQSQGAIKAAEVLQGLKAVLAREKDSFSLEYPCETPTEMKWFKLNVRPFSFQGEQSALIAHEDITVRKRQQDKLKLFQFSVENAAIGICRITPAGNFAYVNNRFCEMLNYSKEELTGKKVSDIDADHSAAEREFYWNKIKQNKINKIETRHQTRDGEIFPVQITSKYLKYQDKEYEFAFVQDITVHKERIKELKYKTFHDELTGLYNRTYLSQEIERLDTKRQLPISVIMVDINGLKIINDSYGHKKGDELLKKAAAMLAETVRTKDILARYGGDEFIILLPQTDNEIAHNIYERIIKQCQETKKDELPLSLGLGVATKNRASENIQYVLKQANENMLQNKLVNDQSSQNRLVKSLLNTLGAKSDETKEHALRMTYLAHKLGEKIGIANSALNKLSLLATLHDIGKTSIPEEVLTKKEELTDEEWQMMKEHPDTGYKIASASPEFSPIAKDIRTHHERWDGSGYPAGLQGKEIPLLARIITIVDAYDVMTNGRPYQEAMSKTEALQEIKACAGSQFDPELAAKFIEMMHEEL